MTSLTAVQPGGTNQTTAWVYGVTPATGSAIDSYDIVGATEYPDPTTGEASSSQEATQTVDAQGNVLTSTDRNGTTHQYGYDSLGREISDTVTALGSGVDGSVMKITTAYDGQGNPYLVTSYNGSGDIVNQVEDLYNGFGQLTQEYQSASGAADPATTPSVQYTYSSAASGLAESSRLASIVYPDGHTVDYNYASGADDDISRLSSLSDSTGTLESYTYQGLNGVIGRAYPQPDVSVTYTPDQFGRIAEEAAVNTSTSAVIADYQYGYDDDGNILWRDNVADSSLGQLYGYDNLGEVTSFAEGTLNTGHTGVTGTAAYSQSWSLDALGNFTAVTTNGTTQTRTANAQNEITAISGATTPTYDANGNLTTDSTGLQYVYDAWNRVVAVKNSGGTTLETFEYDGLDRRIAVTASGTTTNLYYSSQGQVLEEAVAGVYTQRYVWDPVYVNALILRDVDTSGTGLTATGGSYTRLWVSIAF